MAIKAVILIGGPTKGLRFRPLSFDQPKYTFPVGGDTIIGHLIDSCLKINDLSEIILLGFYEHDENLQKLIDRYTNDTTSKSRNRPTIRYLQELSRMGTAGGLYHFRDEILRNDPEAFLVINGDVCGDFDFEQMLSQHRNTPKSYITVMTTQVRKEESSKYGCIVENPENHAIVHYAEKPDTFISNLINCGAYVCSPELLTVLEESRKLRKNEDDNGSPTSSNSDYLSLELDVLQRPFSQNHCFSYRTRGSWWCQVKTAASAIYANRQYLKSNNYSSGCKIEGDVYIHPTAVVHPTAKIGPNVSIMENCVIEPGVRVRESILLRNARIKAHSIVAYSIVGSKCTVGEWVRVEGTDSEPDPDLPLFSADGRLNPSIAVLGCNVTISDGKVILNTMVLPHKELVRSYKNEIVF